MDASQSLPDLIATAQANAATHAQKIAEISAELEGVDETEQHRDALADEVKAIEVLAVDIFAVFEARMQHHFKRGPFSRKLKALLTGAGQPDLAYRIYQYYLAINVLKHGIGASHRELLKTKTHLFSVHATDEAKPERSLVDVTSNDFFDGLTTTILEAYHFLER